MSTMYIKLQIIQQFNEVSMSNVLSDHDTVRNGSLPYLFEHKNQNESWKVW